MIENGDLVIASYKTGTYIGRIIELRAMKAAVQVLAVVQHPEQGNLHAPQQVEGVFFHQRKALAEQEIALMPLDLIVKYEEEDIPNYRESLVRSLEVENMRMNQLALQPELQKWAFRAIEELERLYEEYGISKD
jgi:kinase-associated protein B